MKSVFFFLFFLLIVKLSFAQDSLAGKHPQSPKPPKHIIHSGDMKYHLGIGGYINLTGIYELDNAMQDHLDFITYDIKVPEPAEMRKLFLMNANQSRLSANLLGDTKYGKLKVYLEADFNGVQGAFRLRQAYGSLGGFLVGQTWSTFTDLDASPNTIDAEGPNAEIAFRTTMIRYSHYFTKNLRISLAAETPTASLFVDNQTENQAQFVPEFVSTLKYKNSWGHLQLGGVFRDITYFDSIAGKTQSTPGWGVSGSGSIQFSKTFTFMSQYIYGKGVAKYIQDISDRGMDLIPEKNPDKGKMEALECWGVYGALNISFTKKLSSNLIYSITRVTSMPQLPPDEFKDGQYFAFNIFYSLLPNITIAGEYLWGERKNKNNKIGTAQRMNMMMKFDF
ncbi:MAG: porin [Bacteroidales bacterium]|nr:porin [Bacteroidales bacterium]MCF8387879.1 porin [Bacteroidales bacterium]MCF8398796.1 porin [Bacteroidales bacterium]